MAEAEGAATGNRCLLCLGRLSDGYEGVILAIQGKLNQATGAIGAFVARWPVWVIVLSILATALAGGGWSRFRIESDGNELWYGPKSSQHSISPPPYQTVSGRCTQGAPELPSDEGLRLGISQLRQWRRWCTSEMQGSTPGPSRQEFRSRVLPFSWLGGTPATLTIPHLPMPCSFWPPSCQAASLSTATTRCSCRWVGGLAGLHGAPPAPLPVRHAKGYGLPRTKWRQGPRNRRPQSRMSEWERRYAHPS